MEAEFEKTTKLKLELTQDDMADLHFILTRDVKDYGECQSPRHE